MGSRPVTLEAYWRLLRTNRNFRLLWMAQVVSELGDWLYSVAVYSLLLDLTGTAKSVATAVVLQVLPQFFVSPMAGVLNDRVRRKRVMIAADLARAAIVLGMVVVRSPGMVPLLYLLLFAETVMWAFFEPGRTAILPVLTGNEADTAAANGLSSTTWSVNLALGAAAGGLIAVLLGRNALFVLNAASFLLSAALVSRMRVCETHAGGQTAFRARDLFDYTPFVEGIRYVQADRRLLATLLVKAGQGFLGVHWVILPILGERVFPVAPEALGAHRGGMLGMSLLFGARGVGSLLGPLVSGYWAGNDQRRLRAGIFGGFLAIAAGYLLLSGATTLWQAAGTVILAHAGGSTVWVFSTTLLHFQTEDRFRGRVFSADFGFLTLAMAMVTAAGGVALDGGVSVRMVAFCTGALAFLPAALWWNAQRLWTRPAKVP